MDNKQKALPGYIKYSDCFGKMTVAVAGKSAGIQIPPKTRDAVVTYRGEWQAYENKLRAYKARKAGGVAPVGPIRGSRQSKAISYPVDEPKMPACPVEVRDFLNALEGEGQGIEGYESTVRGYIECKDIPSFILLNSGLIKRLSNINLHSFHGSLGFGPVPLSRDKYAPIVLKESDVQYILEYGSLPSSDAASTVNTTQATANTERQCREWLVDMMKEGAPPKKNKAEYHKEAKKKFKGIGTKMFGRAWATAIADTGSNWDKPGRKS